MATDFDALMKQIQESQDKANAANLQRYNQLLASLDTLGIQVGEAGTYGKALALQEQMGTAGRQRITEQATKTFAAAEQDLTTRGLGNTTIREAVRRGTAHDAEMARQQLEESVAMQKSGLYQGLAGAQLQIGGMRAGAIEGRTDAGPNLGMFASLLSAAAAGDKADSAKMRTSRVLSARTAAGGPGTGWGGSRGAGGGAGGGGIGQMGGGAGGAGGGGATAGRPGTTGYGYAGKKALNLAIDPNLRATGTPALAGAAGAAGAAEGAGKYTSEGYLADPEARAADIAKGAEEVGTARVAEGAKMEEASKFSTYAEYRAHCIATGPKHLPHGGAVSQGYWEQFIKGKR